VTQGALLLLLSGHLTVGGVAPFGSEYRMTQPISGDQVLPNLALGPAGGFLVFQDNRTDGDGYGIGARRLDPNMIGAFDTFRVNSEGADDQENARVALFPDGGAVFVWQGGPLVKQHIFARFLRADGTWSGNDVRITTDAGGTKQMPAVAVLESGEAVIVWESYEQDGSLFGLYGQLLSPSGEKLGGEFQVSQTTLLNQRQPAVGALPGGGFTVAWISERLRSLSHTTPPTGTGYDSTGGALEYDVQVFCRSFDSSGQPSVSESAVSDPTRIAANPSLAVLADGGLLAAWSSFKVQRTAADREARERWDVMAVGLGSDGTLAGEEFCLNQHQAGDQFAPKVTALGNTFQVIWTSMGQDGSREGVFGRTSDPSGPLGEEMQINAITASQQLHPALATTDGSDALVVWSTFTGLDASFDLVAQRMSLEPGLSAPQPPFVQALSQSRLVVTWPRLEGLDVAAYELYVDGEATPIETTDTRHYLNKLTPASEHHIQLAYRLADGQRSPLSGESSGVTWGEDSNYDVLPDDWQTGYWGSQVSAWEGAGVDSDGDGATNLQELLAGTDPVDPDSVLKTSLEPSPQGLHLVWNTQPGCVYQVQVTEDLTTWAPVGSERFAAGTADSMLLQGSSNLVMYRVVLIR